MTIFNFTIQNAKQIKIIPSQVEDFSFKSSAYHLH